MSFLRQKTKVIPGSRFRVHGKASIRILNTEYIVLRSRNFFIIILVILTVTYIGGCRRAGRWLVKEDVPPHADAMVILMGNFPDRVLQAADLYHEGRAGN